LAFFGLRTAWTAPEYVLEKRCDIGSDMWSFGCLIYALYNHGASPVQANDSLAAYTDAVKRAPNASLAALPAPLMRECAAACG